MDEWNDEVSENVRRREERQSEFLIWLIMLAPGVYGMLSATVIAKAHGML